MDDDQNKESKKEKGKPAVVGDTMSPTLEVMKELHILKPVDEGIGLSRDETMDGDCE